MASSPKQKSALTSPSGKAREKKPAKKKVSKRSVLGDPAKAKDLVPFSADVLDELYATVSSRRGTDPSISHSARLLSRGRNKIAQKFGEEAVECVIEAVAGKASDLISESADVLYHLIVMWVDAGIRPENVWVELRRREAQSGIAEKASRVKKP